jgi:hypothetical protein
MRLIERVLENEYVRLEPLQEIHREPLREATSADQEIWTSLYPVSMAGEHFDPSWIWIQNEHGTGSWIPFAVITRASVSDSHAISDPKQQIAAPISAALIIGPSFAAAW